LSVSLTNPEKYFWSVFVSSGSIFTIPLNQLTLENLLPMITEIKLS
jgi:hypothetical protein